ncbi:S8 family peptidase [Pseudomonas sp.]|uniref:S8 family peptidase n=1 Tax=Pseudomonas sp. TaxID=306 RepID=UPI0027368BB3|nr:S8 family peptidase [Pseudomonas sp.]MDP3814124.1 S8 family peptidase [Pseudomonas sp.]
MKISTLVLACTGLLSLPTSQAADATSPFIVVFTPQAIASSATEAAPSNGDYVRPAVRAAAQALAKRHAFSLGYVYSRAIEGFSAKLNARQLKALLTDARVAYIEQDLPMAVLGVPEQAQGKPGGGATPAPQVLPWGIDRVEADNSVTWTNSVGPVTVTGVRAYIIDTGIDTSHKDLNVVGHVNFAGGVNRDCHGHGTHVAGTVGAKDNSQDVVGVAPGVALVGVKVLGCGGSGTTSGVIAGVDWVTANATAPINQGQPAVANMSLGGGASLALDTAVLNSAAAGIFYAVAAGNSGANACLSSPARAGEGDNGVMTTAATDSADQEAYFSNYGSCVDGWAPGVYVLSTKKGGGTTTFSGTSMAAPHTAGGAALYLSTHTADSPATVEAALRGAAIQPGSLSKDGLPIQLLQVDGF